MIDWISSDEKLEINCHFCDLLSGSIDVLIRELAHHKSAVRLHLPRRPVFRLQTAVMPRRSESIWDPMRGATSYRIFRNTTNNSTGAIDVGTTAAPYFFDPTAAQNTNFFYFVRAENGSGVSALSAGAQGLRANGIPNGPVPPLEPPPAPAGNPVTATKVALGKVLFWDEQLSSTRTVSCGTCHINSAGGSDPRSIITNLASTHPGADGVFSTGDDVTGSPGVPLSNAERKLSMDACQRDSKSSNAEAFDARYQLRIFTFAVLGWTRKRHFS